MSYIFVRKKLFKISDNTKHIQQNIVSDKELICISKSISMYLIDVFKQTLVHEKINKNTNLKRLCLLNF